MRHLLSIVLSLILAPLIYIAAGFSAVKLGVATAATSLDWTAAGLGVAGGLFAGGCYALLVMARLSPFGPVLAGLAYIGVTLWAVLDKAGFASALPAKLLGEEGVLLRPVGAGTLLLAVPLLFTIFSPRRWRRKPTPDSAAPLYPGAPASAAPAYTETAATTYPSPTYDPPVYTPAGSAAPTYVPGEPEPPTVPAQSVADEATR